MIPQIINLDNNVFLELTIKLIPKAVPNSKNPAMTKSGKDQSNPSTKRLQKNATANNNAGTAKIRMFVCFSVFIM